MSKPTVAILGAGPSGAAAAWRLRVHDRAEAILLERQADVGGLAGSFELAGIPVDYGSHRLHPACEPRILDDLKALLGDELLDRPRDGRIRLRGRWIKFPLKPLNLMRRLPLSFTIGVGRDILTKLISRRRAASTETFETILQDGLGNTICTEFYFPFARKLWGVAPAELSPVQARRRVSAGSLVKMIRRVLTSVPGLRKPGAGRFYYPRQGYGQITRSMTAEAKRLGATVRLGCAVRSIRMAGTPHLEIETDGRMETLAADHIWSTLPITALVQLLDPPPPSQVMDAIAQTRFRGMVLVYLVLAQGQFTPYDAHYFPGSDMPMSRLSEPKNYAGRTEPTDRTVLCAEMPCEVGGDLWNATDEELGEVVRLALASCDLPVTSRIIEVATRRLPCAYPIYIHGYERCFHTLEQWVARHQRLLTFGRQGLFAHDNLHHTLEMAYAAVHCLGTAGTFDTTLWGDYCKRFDAHVVED